MTYDDFQKMVSEIEKGRKKERYEGYKVIEDMTLTKEQLKTVIKILEDVFLNMSKEERDNTYLFPKGFIVANKTLIEAQKNKSTAKPEFVSLLESQQETFNEKVNNSKEILSFIFKLKQLI